MVTVLPFLVTGQPSSPWTAFVTGVVLVAMGAAWLWFGDFITSSGKSWYDTLGIGWMWNDGLMKLLQKVSGIAFVGVGVLLVLTSGISR